MSIEKVKEYFKQFGIENKIIELEQSSATVELAAIALGCEGKRIAKTLSFLVEENPSYEGMLQKAKDYITWGEIDAETLAAIIAKRGRLPGNVKVTDEYVAENTDYKDIADLSKALIESKVKLADVGIKPVFRLHPPRKGYEDIRLSVNEGGSLGYRGEEIKDLAKRML